MTGQWLNLFLHFSSFIFSLKQKIVGVKSWMRALPQVFLLLLAEAAFLIVSLPLYLVVSPKKLQERGIIFPAKEKDINHFHNYIVRRKISLTTVLSAGGIFLLKFFFISLVSAYLLGAQALLAATQNWDFGTPSDYTYDGAKIEVTGGTAQLKATTSTISGSTTNSSFTSNSTGWTYADWLQPTNTTANGAYHSSGGNPGGYIDIGLSTTKKNKTIAGLWRQSFTTTVNSPTVATVNFDWKSLTYTSPSAPVTYKLYAFIDTGSGNPILGQEVWTSGEITGTTSWASTVTIDIKSKVATAGTYYLKIVAYVTTPNTDNTFNYISNFDNVVVNWSKTTISYDSGKPVIYPTISLSPAGVTSWNAFTETATKGTGEIYYQLSDNDGSTWKYWNNSAWVTSTLATHYNTAAVVNNNIGSFNAASGQITWKAFLSSNGSQQIILDNLIIGYIQNNPPGIQNISPSQNTTSGYVKVNYILTDQQSDPSSLVTYEYSLTGAFSGEQSTMTAVPADPAHSGASGLSSSLSGVAHTFVWNAAADLGNVYSGTVYVRLRANDGIASGDFNTSAVFMVDYVAPVVSSVTAVQAPASSDINIGYNLFDNTADNILVQLQVSSDGGVTWAVPATSVTGDVGSTVTSGNGKVIVWQAGTDFANQEQNNMMVRIRAKDKYQNQGSYVDSASFVLDNRAPIIATPTNLLAQPVAGATAVLVGGNFAEGNPNTNDFYVAINGGSYGSAQAGDTNTATPSDKSVPVETTLDGNDYISAVKITHTDDFGLATANENNLPNSVYKYIKPYTPPAPTIGNPGESSLDVTINKNSAEVDGLEYAIFENTQNQYVQVDGTLGASPHWQAIETITVTGLVQPLPQYNFQVKSRNTSDANHAATSESDFGNGASSDYQSPQIVINSVVQTMNGTKYVIINYTGTDHQNQANNLVKYEYSLNGTDWQAMTEKSGVGSDGMAGLAFTNSGANLMFAWDVGTDLPNVEDSAVYVRLESNDSVTNSNIAVSPAFTVNTAGPVVSNIQAKQTPATDDVAITYDLTDGAGANNTVALLISDDGGATYSVLAPSKSGDVGSGITAGLTRNIIWHVGADFPNQEKNTMRVKIAATDIYGNQGSPFESADFSVDTKAPIISNVAAAQDSGSALVAVTYNLADLSSVNVEFEVSADSGATWSVATTTYTGDVGLGQTAGAKTFNWNAATDFPDQESDTMRLRVRATDVFGHLSNYQESADFSVNTKVLSISNITAEQNLGAPTVTIHYDLNKTATINLDISSDGGTTWNVATTTLAGQIGAGITTGNNKAITWNASTDFNNEESTIMRVRLSGIDAYGTVSPYYESADFSVDTAPPLGLLSLSKFASTNDSVTMNWSAGVADAHFNHYELWHGANQNDVISRSGTAIKWAATNDSNLNSPTAISTVITGINLTSDYFVKIWAIDNYGNESTITELNIYSAPIVIPPTVENVGGGGYTPIIDLTPPNAPIVLSPKSGDKITEATPVLIGVAEPLSQIEITLDKENKFTATADMNGAWQFKLPSDFALQDGTHSFALIAIDQAGNKSAETALDLNKITLKIALPLLTTVPTPSTPAIAPAPALISTPVPTAQLVQQYTQATELAGVPIPTVANVNMAATNGVFTFTGTALPNQDIIVYVHSDQALIYRTKTDSKGVWTVNHSQADVELASGEHTIYAVAVDPAAQVKSQPSPVSTFTVNKNFWVSLFERLNLQTTAVTLAIVLLIMVWLYWIKKREAMRV